MSEVRREERRRVVFPARLNVFEHRENVVGIDLSKGGCKIRCSRPINVLTKVILEIYGKSQCKEEQFTPYDPIPAVVRWCRPSSDGEQHNIGLQFSNPVTESHGVLQLIQPERFEPKVRKMLTTHTALIGKYVSCHVCGQGKIPFYALRSKSILIRSNIFGTPTYVKPLGDRDYCDFNLLQVTICPGCYFAANGEEYFRVTSEDEVPFDSVSFYQEWKETVEERRLMVAPQADALFSEERSWQQALLSYQLAEDTFRALCALNPESGEYVRKLANVLVTHAQVLMAGESTGGGGKEREQAERLLQEASEVLQEKFTVLTEIQTIRAALLISTIGVYFGDMKAVGQFMKYLDNFDRDNQLDPKSEQAKVLRLTQARLNDIFQDRELYHRDKLNSFFLET